MKTAAQAAVFRYEWLNAELSEWLGQNSYSAVTGISKV